MLADICKKIESDRAALSNEEIFSEFNLLKGHPWESNIDSPTSNYYNCIFNIVKREKPRYILEIGTAFGLSAASMLKASPDIELFISIDLGIYGEQLGFSQNNIDFARSRVHQWCCKNHIPLDRIRFYRANSQPERVGDNENIGEEIRRWHQVPDLVRLLTQYEFDVIFVDGKHTDDGLFNDFVTVWPMLRDGGLLLCDDLHDEATYREIFSWAGQTIDSFHRFTDTHSQEIEDTYIWNYPQVPPADYTGLRPFGLIRKRKSSILPSRDKGFEVFDVPEAHEINRARQDHLASLGLDLAHKTVLEVGSGVGMHTGFFEKLGCNVLSTDARPENVTEHLRRYPRRKGHVDVADLNAPGSHKKYGKFDIVYCYGTLYHLADPALCIKELSENCTDLFLLETCVNFSDNNDINRVLEESQWKNQSFNGVGCRPARDWIVSELKKYYPYVYCCHYQPAHDDFPLNWPADAASFINTREAFVASRMPLENRSLLLEIPSIQKKLDPLILSDKAQTLKDRRGFSFTRDVFKSLKRRVNYCRSSIIFDKAGEKLARSLEVNTYFEGDRKQALITTSGGLSFVPTGVRDHLATPFFKVSPTKEIEIRIRITLSFFEKHPWNPNCILYLQDLKFYRVSVNFDFVKSPQKNVFGRIYQTSVVTLPCTIEKFRIFIASNNGKPITIPYSIRIEQLKHLFNEVPNKICK